MMSYFPELLLRPCFEYSRIVGGWGIHGGRFGLLFARWLPLSTFVVSTDQHPDQSIYQ